MSVEVTVVANALAPHETETHVVPELVPWLIERFGRWPATGRLYHRLGSFEHDVTPQVPDDCAYLSTLSGSFVVRIFPAGLDPITGVGGMVFGAIKLLDWILPDVPNIKTPQQRAAFNAGSPNNTLGKASNQARPDQRIPYIVGAVRAVPDLLAVPYTTYVDHVEVETAYYCVGVGEHTLQDIRDGDTLISQISGASAEVYGPGKAPTGGVGFHDPDLTIGEAIEDDVYQVYQLEAVNGQELRAFNDLTFYGSAFPLNEETAILMSFYDNGDGTGIISVPYSSDTEEVTSRVAVGDELFVYWPTEFVPPGGVGTAPDLNTPVTDFSPLTVDALTVTAIDDTEPSINYVHLTVDIPSGQQSEWALLQTYFEDLQDPGDLFPYEGAAFPHAQVTNLRDVYAGPFFIDFEHGGDPSTLEIVCNFVAPRGLFADDGVTTRAMNVVIAVQVTPADSSGNPTGAAQDFTVTLEGSSTARGSRAVTLRCNPTGFTSTRCIVRARRITNTPRKARQVDQVEEDVFGADLDADPPLVAVFSGTVVDEIRWTHCYSMTKPGNISFGNATTIHTRTVATSGATRIKERQLNCFAYRKIQTWDGDSFGGAVVANDQAENILFTIMKDSTIGNLSDANIDFTGIVAACAAVRESVGAGESLATSFNFTFDDADVSFEETLQTVCQSVFCTAFRRGTVLSARPEIAGDDSVILLGHRNILQDTQRFTTTFGAPTENDAVEVGFVDPTDNAQTKVTVPTVGPRLRPKQLKVVGLRSAQQAYWHAYRAHHKMLHQRVNVTLEATQEAEAVGARERVLVANLGLAGTQDGNVVGFDEDDSIIHTSQPVALQSGKAYTLYLQRPDGSVGEYPVLSSPSARELEVGGSPDPIVDLSDGIPTLYMLAPDDAPAPRAFLVSSVRASTPLTHQVEAVNYSHMYYLADGLLTWVDFLNGGVVDHSPVRRTLVSSGGSIGAGGWVGEFGDSFEAATPAADLNASSYSKLVWINATSSPTLSHLIEANDADAELFEITSGDLLLAGHEGSSPVSVDYSDYTGSEHCVAVTYNETTERMALFIDGALAAEGTVTPAAPGWPMIYLQNFEGTCRMALRWGRTLSDREVMEIYLRTRA